MASWAKVGTKVVCVDGRIVPGSELRPGQSIHQVLPTEGRVYTISWVGPFTWADGVNGIGVHLAEFRRASSQEGLVFPLGLRRFRPLVTKTQDEDVSMFKRIVSETPFGLLVDERLGLSH